MQADFNSQNSNINNNITTSTINLYEEMLSDEVKMLSFKYAIQNNKEIFKDKIVLEVGCGTGILSIFSLQAGAQHVYAIENSDMLMYTKQIIKDNFMEDKITFYQGDISEIELPVDKVDIIISDWMGSFLLYESKIHEVISARDKWLKDDGLILPNKAVINLAAIEDYQYKDIKINFWRNVYDVDMSPIRKAAVCEVLSDNIDKHNLISTICPIYEIDLYTINEEDLDFASKYELKIMKDESVHAFITWFDVQFENLPFPVSFNTSPFSEPTFWKQCILYFDEEYPVHKGEIINGSIAVRRSLYNMSHLDVKISVNIAEQGQKDKIVNFIQLYKYR